MSDVVMLWIALGLMVFSFIDARRSSKKEKKEKKLLRAEIQSLQGTLRVYKRAAMHDLSGVETRDLHNLVYHDARLEKDKFEEIWRGASGKVQQSFLEYKERDEPILLLHRS